MKRNYSPRHYRLRGNDGGCEQLRWNNLLYSG